MSERQLLPVAAQQQHSESPALNLQAGLSAAYKIAVEPKAGSLPPSHPHQLHPILQQKISRIHHPPKILITGIADAHARQALKQLRPGMNADTGASQQVVFICVTIDEQ
jgi:hypothetical protein